MSGSCVVSFDQIAVVTIHDAHELRQAGRAGRMQARAQFRGSSDELCDQVSQRFWIGFEQARLNPIGCFLACRRH